MKTAIRIFLPLLFSICCSVQAQKLWTLEECLQQAASQHPEVLIRQMRNQILDKEVQMARNDRLPSAAFNYSQGFSLGNSYNVSTSVGQLSNSATFLGLNAGMVLFEGFRYKHQLQKAALSAQKGKAELEVLRFDLSLQIIDKYLQILFLRENLRVAEQQLMISRQHLERLQQLNRKAFADKSELLEMQSASAADERAVILLKNDIANRLIELSTLLQLDDPVSFDITDLPPHELDVLLGRLSTSQAETDLSRHPAIRSAALDTDIKQQEIHLAKAGLYPTVSLAYSLSSNYFHIMGQKDQVYNQDTKQLEANGLWQQLNNNHTHYFGLSTSIPIFNKFATRQTIRIAQEELRIAEIEMTGKQTQLRNDLRMARNDLATAHRELETGETALSAQQQAFEILQQQYRQGSSSNFEFLEGKARLMEKNSDYIRAKYNCLFKAKILEQYRQW
jgi:outer membrane protein